MIDLNKISSLADLNFLLEENFLLGLNQEIILYDENLARFNNSFANFVKPSNLKKISK